MLSAGAFFLCGENMAFHGPRRQNCQCFIFIAKKVMAYINDLFLSRFANSNAELFWDFMQHVSKIARHMTLATIVGW